MSSSNIANGLNTHVAPHYSEQSDSSRPSTGQPQSQPQKFTPFTTGKHHVTKGRYITSNDPRGYVPVYEYPLNGQWIMMDVDDGYILWTGIWKALGNSKADIVKMIESQPDLAPQLRRVRGGYLKIQGTWMPYEVAMKLSRRVAWTIREDLVPLFGPQFPSTCLSPDKPGYGQVIPNPPGRRRPRRSVVAAIQSHQQEQQQIKNDQENQNIDRHRQASSHSYLPHHSNSLSHLHATPPTGLSLLSSTAAATEAQGHGFSHHQSHHLQSHQYAGSSIAAGGGNFPLATVPSQSHYLSNSHSNHPYTQPLQNQSGQPLQDYYNYPSQAQNSSLGQQTNYSFPQPSAEPPMRQNMSSNVPISNYGQSMQMSSQAPQSLGQNSADHPFLYSSSSSASSQEYASGSPTRTGSGGTRGSRSHRFTPYPGSNPHGQIDIPENQLGSYQSTGMPNSGNGYHFPPNQQLHHGDIHDSVEASVQHSSSGLSLPPLTVPSSLSSSSGTQYSARPYSRDKDWDRERAWEREKEYADSTNYSLPPISSLATTNRASGGDSAAVLKRLSVQTEGARMTGEVSYQTSDVPSGVNLGRRRSLSEPVLPINSLTDEAQGQGPPSAWSTHASAFNESSTWGQNSYGQNSQDPSSQLRTTSTNHNLHSQNTHGYHLPDQEVNLGTPPSHSTGRDQSDIASPLSPSSSWSDFGVNGGLVTRPSYSRGNNGYEKQPPNLSTLTASFAPPASLTSDGSDNHVRIQGDPGVTSFSHPHAHLQDDGRPWSQGHSMAEPCAANARLSSSREEPLHTMGVGLSGEDGMTRQNPTRPW